MIALSETLRAETAAFGVRVTVVCPSFFTTNLMESYRGPDEGARELAGRLMDRSRLDADDIADAVVFLAGASARWITGQTLVVDGGTLVRQSIV